MLNVSTYVCLPVVIDSVRCACMLQCKQLMISYLVPFHIIHCVLDSAIGDLLSACTKPYLCVVTVFVCVY